MQTSAVYTVCLQEHRFVYAAKNNWFKETVEGWLLLDYKSGANRSCLRECYRVSPHGVSVLHCGNSDLLQKWRTYPWPWGKMLWLVEDSFICEWPRVSWPSLRNVLDPSTTTVLPWGSDSKESACSVGDLGLIPGSGGSPGEGNGNPL